MVEDLTILVGNLGDLRNLRPCLQSLYSTITGDTSFRVIVGFNSSNLANNPQTLAHEFPQVEQMHGPSKLGYCRVYNQLMTQSTGRYVLLLDDDTILDPGTIDGMVRFLDTHPDVGIAGCRTRNQDGSYQKSTALMFGMASELMNTIRPAAFWRDGINESVTGWKEVGWLNGHFLMLRQQVIDQVGKLDEHFYTFVCEADWCRRIQQAGWKVAYIPDFQVMHIGGAHSITTSVKTEKNLLRSHINRYYFFRKHYGNVALHAFRFVMSIGAALRLLNYILVWTVSAKRRPEAKPKLAAYWKIFLLGAAARPDDLPDQLKLEHSGDNLVLCQPPGRTSSHWA